MSLCPVGEFAASILESVKPVCDRSDGEKMILLMLRRGNEIAKACVAIGERLGWKPSKKDWRSLIACRLVKRDERTGFLVLTAGGLARQQLLAHAMCRASELHFLMPHTSSRFEVTARCTCGWRASLSKNQGHVISRQFAAFGQHIDAVRKGVWKKPRSVEEIFAEVMGPGVAPQQPVDGSAVPQPLPSPETVEAPHP